MAKEQALKEEQARKHEREQKASVERMLDDLARRHNAVRNWATPYQKPDESMQVFTLEVQDSFAQLKGRPIIVIGRVSDVYRAGNAYRVLCQYEPRPSHVYDSRKVIFVLETDEALARKIISTLNDASDFPRALAFAVSPQRMEVVHLREQVVVGQYIQDSEEFPEGGLGETEIEQGDVQPHLQVSGRCLGAILDGDFTPADGG